MSDLARAGVAETASLVATGEVSARRRRAGAGAHRVARPRFSTPSPGCSSTRRSREAQARDDALAAENRPARCTACRSRSGEIDVVGRSRPSGRRQLDARRCRRRGRAPAPAPPARSWSGRRRCPSSFPSPSPPRGITRNPWDHSRTPGGSSGGTAVAVSSGWCRSAWVVTGRVDPHPQRQLRAVRAQSRSAGGSPPRRTPTCGGRSGPRAPHPQRARQRDRLRRGARQRRGRPLPPAATSRSSTPSAATPAGCGSGGRRRPCPSASAPTRRTSPRSRNRAAALTELGTTCAGRPATPDPTAAFVPQFFAGIRAGPTWSSTPTGSRRRTRETRRLGSRVTPRSSSGRSGRPSRCRPRPTRVFDEADVLLTPAIARTGRCASVASTGSVPCARPCARCPPSPTRRSGTSRSNPRRRCPAAPAPTACRRRSSWSAAPTTRRRSSLSAQIEQARPGRCSPATPPEARFLRCRLPAGRPWSRPTAGDGRSARAGAADRLTVAFRQSAVARINLVDPRHRTFRTDTFWPQTVGS